MKKAPEAFRTISEVAEILKTPAHVLRFWESKFYQIRPVKRAGGRRYYRPDDVALINGIRGLLQDQGMTIRGVQRVLQDQGVKHVVTLGSPLPILAADDDSAVIDADAVEDTATVVEHPQMRDANENGPEPAAVQMSDQTSPADQHDAPESPETAPEFEPESEPDPESEADPVDELPDIELPDADLWVPEPDVADISASEPSSPDTPAAGLVPGAQAAPEDEDAMTESDELAPPAFTDARPEQPADTLTDTLLAAARHTAPASLGVSSDPAARDTQTGAQDDAGGKTGDEAALPDRARIAQTLRSLPRGRLGPRKDALQLAARRIDTLLERMSEASGAGRW